MTRREALILRNTTHGLSQDENGKTTRMYGIWSRMKQRCNCKTCNDYAIYGGRGIKVCNEWNDYAVFHSWAMSNGYDDTLTIERVDVNGDYCPENCKWITREEQARNKRNNRRITYNGETKILQEWARTIGIEHSLLRYRLAHWGIEKTFQMWDRRTK